MDRRSAFGRNPVGGEGKLQVPQFSKKPEPGAALVPISAGERKKLLWFDRIWKSAKGREPHACGGCEVPSCTKLAAAKDCPKWCACFCSKGVVVGLMNLAGSGAGCSKVLRTSADACGTDAEGDECRLGCSMMLILISMPVAATVAVIIVVLLSVLALVPVAVVIVGAVVGSL